MADQDTQGTSASGGNDLVLRESLAEWLIQTEYATHAVARSEFETSGGWEAPSVLGVLLPRADDLFRSEPQVLAAEIVADLSRPVSAFGHAVAYRLFAHRSFLVISANAGLADIERLRALCSSTGLGLVMSL